MPKTYPSYQNHLYAACVLCRISKSKTTNLTKAATLLHREGRSLEYALNIVGMFGGDGDIKQELCDIWADVTDETS